MSSSLLYDISQYKISKHFIQKTPNIIIPIGILPGYNNLIDTNNFDFEKDLMHNFTFIDLIPVSYNLKMLDFFYDSIKNFAQTGNIFNAVTGSLMSESEYRQQLKNELNTKFSGSFYEYSADVKNTVAQTFASALKKYFGNFFTENNLYILRLIGSQDSVFSETLQNRFGDNNIVDDISFFGKNMVRKFAAVAEKANAGSILSVAGKAFDLFKEIPKYNYDMGINIMKSLAGKTSLGSIFDKELLGLQISLPRVFENSSYIDSLNVFIRLTSPTGTDEDIRSYILTPLIILLTAAAPISFDGITYGYPPIWQIKSYGNSFQTVGVIDVITITRGSMETTYSDNLEPLSIDVRITLSSLNHHYATILKDITKNSLLLDNGVGMTTAANIEAGITEKSIDNLKIYSIKI